MAAIFLQLVEGSVQQLTSLRACWVISNKESQTAVQMVWVHYAITANTASSPFHYLAYMKIIELQ